MTLERRLVGFFCLVVPVVASASLAPISYNAQSAYAGTNGGFNFLSSQGVTLSGPFGLDETVNAPSNGAESAMVRRQVSIDSQAAWLRVASQTTYRSSTGADGWLDFTASDSLLKFEYAVSVAPIVWWDSALVRVYDMTASSVVVSKSATESGSMNIATTPGHQYRLYVGLNQNNLNGFSYPSGNTAFSAEGKISAVPEPATLLGVGMALAGFMARRRR